MQLMTRRVRERNTLGNNTSGLGLNIVSEKKYVQEVVYGDELVKSFIIIQL